MRLFVAVLPPPAALTELGRAADALHALPGAESLRWVERAGWHFTLAFLGEVAEETLVDLGARLARSAHRTPPFQLALHGGGRFGDRALWVGAEGEVDIMCRLAERASAAARKAGIRMEEHRRYTPHLTLARSRTARRGGHGAATVALRPFVEELDGFAGTPWTVEEFSLVHSRPPRSGVPGEQPRYEEVGRWVLGSAG